MSLVIQSTVPLDEGDMILVIWRRLACSAWTACRFNMTFSEQTRGCSLLGGRWAVDRAMYKYALWWWVHGKCDPITAFRHVTLITGQLDDVKSTQIMKIYEKACIPERNTC